MKDYNVHEVLAILQEYYITDSQQMVTRWIRQGKLNGIRGANRKEGFLVAEDDLFEFIEEQRPGLPSILEVYKDYVRQINPEHVEKEIQKEIEEAAQTSVIEHQEINNEREVIQLKDQVASLEYMVMDLQEEKQIVEMRMIELMEQISSLNEEVKSLVEENSTFSELYSLIDEENKQLKDQINDIRNNTAYQDIDNNKSKQKNSIDKPNTNVSLSFEEFKKLGEGMVSKLNFTLQTDELENHLKEIYKHIFDDNGEVIKELLLENGSVKCPYTDKPYKQQKRLINNAIKYYFKNLEIEELNGQMKTTVANN